MKTRKSAAVVLAVIACLSAAHAAEPKDYSQGLLDREQVLAAAAQVTNQAHPNADLVQVDDFTLCEYRPDGLGVTWSDNYTKVLTEKGRREQQELSFGFQLPYGDVAVTRLEVIKPDGSVAAVDIEKQSRVMIDRSQMSANIYNPNIKILRVGVPGVQIGDVVHAVVRREILKCYMPDTWTDYQVFESTAPVKHAVYEVHAPSERTLIRIALKDPVGVPVKHTKDERDGKIVYRWEFSDVPRFYAEPDMPPYHTVVQRLLVSTVPDWETISRWYWRLCEPHLKATTPEMQEMVDKLTAGLTDRQRKIEAIFQWASQQVRYMGITIEEEAPDLEPHDVRFTFEKRHGVCRDKAALLVAMLRLADFEAYPVLIHAGPKRDPEVPTVGFNHAITCVRNEDGSYQLMDCTDESTKDLLPSYLCDRSYLVAHPQGETLQTSPIVPAEENMVLVETTGEIDAHGNLTAETELKLNGINDNAYRGYFARIKPEERRRYFEGVLKATVTTATLTDFELRPANMQDTSQNLSIRMKFTAKNILVGEGDTRMMPVPNVGTRVGLVNFIIGRTGLKKRRFPMQTQYTCGVRETLNLQVDPALGSLASVPDFTPIEDSTISWKRTLDVAQPPSAGVRTAPEGGGATLRGQSEFLIETVEFDPQQYLQLKESLKEIEYNERKMPILTRQIDTSAPAADAVVLDHRVEYNLSDARNWTERHHVKKRVLTYKGMKDNAELKLDYNPAWEAVNLLKASVTNNGEAKETGKDEINLMDAGWVASAPRYPAAKTLVASLPAVELGSVIEYEYERIKKNRPFFAATHVFRGSDPIDQRSVKLTAPASVALRFIRDDNGIAIPDEAPTGGTKRVIAESTELQGGKTALEWKVRDQAALKQEDSLPPYHSFNPVLRITAGDWKAYAGEMLAALREAADGQSASGQRAREVTQNAQSTEEKITAIRDFVAKNIRAAGPGCDDLPLDAITSADRTLADGYGNTTDRAVLLYAMLQAVGFSPEFVLVNYGSQVAQLQQFEEQYPNAHAFGGVLVRLSGSAGPIYLNDTNQYAVLGTTRADNHLALPLARGETEIVSIAQDKRDMRQYDCRIALTEGGDARIAHTRRNYGDSFAGRNRMFTEMPPEERDRFYQEMVAEISQAAVADSDLVTDFASYPGVESFSVQAQRYAVRDGDFLYFELPRSLRHLFGLRSDTHENPFYQDSDYNVRIVTTVELPKAFSEAVLLPEKRQWRLPGDGGIVRVDVARQTDADGGTVLVFTHEVDLNPFILGPEAYQDLVEIENELTHAQARTVLVVRKKAD